MRYSGRTTSAAIVITGDCSVVSRGRMIKSMHDLTCIYQHRVAPSMSLADVGGLLSEKMHQQVWVFSSSMPDVLMS